MTNRDVEADAAQAGGVQDWPEHFRDLDPQARAASDKLDRAGYYDEATLVIQLLNLAKYAVLEVVRAQPSPQPIEAHSKSQFKRLTAMGVEVVEAGRAATEGRGWIQGDRATDALTLAERFHEAYERLAPEFGYETRPETRKFSPDTKNGRLMVAVCRELLTTPPRSET